MHQEFVEGTVGNSGLRCQAGQQPTQYINRVWLQSSHRPALKRAGVDYHVDYRLKPIEICAGEH